MEIRQIAVFHSPLGGKFGAPRQSGLVDELHGEIEFLPQFYSPEAFRGLDGFERLWLIWGFHLNEQSSSLTVRPPRLGGNERLGVYATRSPFRPNPLGLSCVKILSINESKGIIEVSGADLVDGTPIYDVKPYIPYTDAHPNASAGFVDSTAWEPLEVEFPGGLRQRVSDPDTVKAISAVLSQDPRPQYHNDPTREYGMNFGGYNIRFKVKENKLTITDIQNEKDSN